MKSLLLLPVLVVLVSCKGPAAEVAVSQTRELTTKDESFKVNASSAERFLSADIMAQINAQGGLSPEGGASGWTYVLPADWKAAESRPLREVNLSFGAENPGEVYLSLSGGGVQPNSDRWFRQFGLSPKPLSELGRVSFLGGQAYLVEAEGRYEPGMGRAGKDGQGLLGVLIEREGRLVTVKMIGEAAEVASRREEFILFVDSIKRVE